MEGGRRPRRSHAHFRCSLPGALINVAIAFWLLFLLLSVFICFLFSFLLFFLGVEREEEDGRMGVWEDVGGVAFPVVD